MLESTRKHNTPLPPIPYNFGGRVLDLSRPHVMGILNVTPDSFSDGGELLTGENNTVSIDKVLQRAEQMVKSGAAIIDIGGESTRPGAKLVSSEEELDRVLPVVEAISNALDIIISVDTSNPEIINKCKDYRVGLINDVRALSREGAIEAAAKIEIPVCLMHMQGQPESMQEQPNYTNVVSEVSSFLVSRVKACEAAGISRARLLLDPGFGFGKSNAHNIELLGRLGDLLALDLPLLIGLSRKRMLGFITDRIEKERMAAGLAAAVIAVINGARIIRTHDVAQTVDAIKVCQAVMTVTNE